MKRRLALAAAGAALSLAVIAPGAFAAPPESCWGTVTAQRAATYHDMGTHSSSFAGEPRLGLGNVARLFLGDDGKVYELGSLLASLDGLDATFCP